MTNPPEKAGQVAVGQELKACPFCGCPARLVGMDESYIECSDCGASTDVFAGTHREGAITAWNARTPDASQAELVSALEEALAYLEGTNPLHSSNGHRNCDLRDRLKATLSRTKGEAK